MFINGSSLYFHLINPLLAISSVALFERETKLKPNAPELALIPSVIYALIIYPLIVTEKIAPPYPFLNVYAQPLYMSFIWFLILLASAYLFSFGLYFISTNGIRKNKKH